MGVSWMPYNLHHHSTYKKAKRPKKPSPEEIEELASKLDEYERHAKLNKIGQEIGRGALPPPPDPLRPLRSSAKTAELLLSIDAEAKRQVLDRARKALK